MAYDPNSGMYDDAFTRKVRSHNEEIRRRLEEDIKAGAGLSPGVPGVSSTSPTSPSTPSYANLLTIAGSAPDWAGILNSDPLLLQFKRDTGAESIADRSSLRAARQRAVSQFGLVPNLGDPELNADVNTAEVRGLAQRGTDEGLTTYGRLQREYGRASQNVQDALAARGALRSGATGIALRDLNQDYKVSLNDAQSRLLEYLGGMTKAFTDAERMRARDIARAQTEAAGRIPADKLAGTPARQAKHIGNGIYEDEFGELWNPDGTRFTGPDPRKQQAPPQETPPQEEPVARTPMAFDPVPNRPQPGQTRFLGF